MDDRPQDALMRVPGNRDGQGRTKADAGFGDDGFIFHPGLLKSRSPGQSGDRVVIDSVGAERFLIEITEQLDLCVACLTAFEQRGHFDSVGDQHPGLWRALDEVRP